MSKHPPRKKRATVTGRMLRPEAMVLSEAALVPEHRLIKPPPNRFTHELQRPQVYYYDDPVGTPDGELAAGTPVVLMVHDGGRYCRVVDPRGLYLMTAYDGLRAR
jgi:hypothetical protein